MRRRPSALPRAPFLADRPRGPQTHSRALVLAGPDHGPDLADVWRDSGPIPGPPAAGGDSCPPGPSRPIPTAVAAHLHTAFLLVGLGSSGVALLSTAPVRGYGRRHPSEQAGQELMGPAAEEQRLAVKDCGVLIWFASYGLPALPVLSEKVLHHCG